MRRLFSPVRALGGVRLRLTLWYLAVIAVLFLIFSGIVAGTLVQQAQAQNEAALTSAANQLASTYNSAACTVTLDDPWQNGTLRGKPAVSLSIAKDGGLGLYGVAVLYDANRQPCASATDGTPQVYGPITSAGVADLSQFVFDKLPYLRLPASISDMPLEVRTTPNGGGVTAGYSVYVMPVGGASSGRVLVVGSMFDSNAALQPLVPALLIGGSLTLLIAALGGYWLATRAMRPVRLLTRTARDIGERDLDRRLNLASRDELGELARTFDGMLDRLQAAFARQRQFTADASHELRTPLTVVDLEVTRALAQRPLAPEEYARVLGVVQAENAYMARLVDDLLTLARADAGQAALRPEPLDLSDVALDVVERLAPLARQRGLSLEVGALPELPVRGDRTYLARAVSNLVENAIKYTAGVGSVVHLEAGADGADFAWLRVADDGPGIAPEHLPHLCDRFYRVDVARSRAGEPSTAADGERTGDNEGGPDGTGLGLSIVEWVAHVSGGELRIRSTVGQGAVFELRLPLAGRPDAAALPAAIGDATGAISRP